MAVRLAVLCPSDIALRRFLPALKQLNEFEFAGIGAATADERIAHLPSTSHALQEADSRTSDQLERAKTITSRYGGKLYDSFRSLIDDETIDALYIPLPPALHYAWACRALCAEKHIFLEKPFTTNLKDTRSLLELATKNNLAVHENYMFAFHSQIDYVKGIILDGILGEIRTIRIDFGFPFRGNGDFRYSSELGGGALLDCGGYTLKLASMLLGPDSKVTTARLCQARNCQVDVFGTATVANNNGLAAQVSFGMDNDYRCNIDIWGSKGSLFSGRILTAPAGFQPTITIRRNNEDKTVTLPCDDCFKKSIQHFYRCITDNEIRAVQRNAILHQAQLVESVFDLGTYL